MIPLSTKLDDVDFDILLQKARRRLPALAPGWTDYNYHDPGIMLVELLAWVADSQVYSLGRNRRDERLAMARLLGVEPRGSRPARGVVYPQSLPPGVQQLAQGCVLKAINDRSPRLETAADVTLLPVEIKRIAVRAKDGSIVDQTDLNARARATFQPFGPDGSGQLLIELKPVSPDINQGSFQLSLGIELGRQSRSATVISGARRLGFYGVDGKRLDVDDRTEGLQRNGVWIINLEAAELKSPLVVRPESGFPLFAQLLEIRPNGVPVEQRATVKIEGLSANGQAGQQVELVPSALFPADEPTDGQNWRLTDARNAVEIELVGPTSAKAWKRGNLDEAGPHDTLYAFREKPDASGILIGFGNGINGARPPVGSTISITLRLSCGSSGNVRKTVDWLLEDFESMWSNLSPIAGGRDSEDVDQTLAAAAARLGQNRILAISDDFARAIAPLQDCFDIARAEIAEGVDEGRHNPREGPARTLVLVHRVPGSETSAWCKAVRTRLLPRIAIGERFYVAPPSYARFSVEVHAQVARGLDRKRLANAILGELKSRFDVASKQWPLGGDVSSIAIAGWIRKLDGISTVLETAVLVDGTKRDQLAVEPAGLPLYDQASTIIVLDALP